MEVLNPFVGQAVAARYARARPALHHHVAELVLARQPKVRRALDLACGTGLSTTPLLALARQVVGVDVSSEMLALAPRSDRVSYVQAAAERVPFEDSSFDLATICSALHWFDPLALQELHRVVRTEGSLVVYDVWFPAEMVGEPRFAKWMSQMCAPRYPQVQKRHDNRTALLDAGFRPTWSADPRYEVRMGVESLAGYLMTHSERVAAIERGDETEAEQADFLTEGLRFLFPSGAERTLVFGIWVQAFKRQASA
jgi:ubiquinone/menaquinone biosynthesis C-methylase UbiE